MKKYELIILIRYFNSFWVKTEKAGKDPSYIEARCFVRELKKGGIYIFQFEYSTTKKGTFPVIIRGSKEYFKDIIISEMDKTYYSKRNYNKRK